MSTWSRNREGTSTTNIYLNVCRVGMGTKVRRREVCYLLINKGSKRVMLCMVSLLTIHKLHENTKMPNISTSTLGTAPNSFLNVLVKKNL